MKYSDIWLVDFDPSVGHEYKNKRPALIVQSDQQLSRSSVVTVIPITSKTNNNTGDDIRVSKSKQNKLYLDSLLKVHYLSSFDQSRFSHKIGEVDDSTMTKVKEYLKKHFGIGI